MAKVKIGKLVACIKDINTNESFCTLQKMEKIELTEEPILNELDCPLIEETHRFEVTPSESIKGTISLVHQCGISCSVTDRTTITVEREKATISTYSVQHDWHNKMYCINIYSCTLYQLLSVQ